jgi:hypothetical protein
LRTVHSITSSAWASTVVEWQSQARWRDHQLELARLPDGDSAVFVRAFFVDKLGSFARLSAAKK